VKIIPLTQGKFALVDDEDFTRISIYKWQAHKSGSTWRVKRGDYDPATQNSKNIWLSRFILGVSEFVDHRNGDPFDNQKHNLRLAGKSGNQRGFRKKSLGKSSRFRGVFWNTQAGAWHARLTIENRAVHCGYFYSEKNAALAYDAAAKKYFGEFASPNFK
jgi:hypothetical protein